MFGVQGLVMCLGVCALFFSGCQAASTFNAKPPVYVWPLGDNIVGLELNTHVRECDSSNLLYATGPATLNYSVMGFASEVASYVDLPIANEPRLVQDMSFTFHLYPETDGTFFHYKSHNATEVGVAEIKIKVASGDFVTSLASNDGSFSNRTTPVGLPNGTWSRIIVERDLNTDKLTFYAEWPSASTSATTNFYSWPSNQKILFPGKLRLGGSQDGESFFTGRLACLQLVDTKNPKEAGEYDAECMQQNWPTTSTIAATVPATCVAVTTTSTTTSTSTSTTSSTTTTPTTTLTSTTTPTTTTTSTTTPTTTTTSTTTPTTTTTSTTTPTPTPTSTTTSTTTSTSTTTTPATTITSMMQTTTTAPATTTTPSTPVSPALQSFVPAISSMNMGCSHLSATPGATYVSFGDVLQTVVDDLRECVWLCVRDGGCGSFVHSGGVCQTGVTSPSLVSDAGKTMYILQ